VCGDFETHDEAVKHLHDPNFGDTRRKQIQETIRELHERDVTAELVVVSGEAGKTITAREKKGE